MSIKKRLIVMLALIVALIGTALILLFRSEDLQTDDMIANLKNEAEAKLDGLLGKSSQEMPPFEIGSQALRSFVADYAHSTDMGAFIASGSHDMAAADIDSDLVAFRTNAFWILRPDGTQIYGAVRHLNPALRTLMLPTRELCALLEHKRGLHFYLDSSDGLLEVIANPVRTAMATENSKPTGWLLAAKLWDEEQLKSISLILESTTTLLMPGEAPPQSGVGVSLVRDLQGWDGVPVRRLHILYAPPLLKARILNDTRGVALMAFFGLLVILLALVSVLSWVIRPLQHIERSLVTGSTEPIAGLLGEHNEFGRLARLVRVTFQQRTNLHREIEERSRVEESLLASTELRLKLARDLHDNVIQSIYATGLGLESLRQELRSNPDEAERRLDAARANLNQTIREVRGFISGLEPESEAPRDLAKELQLLADSLQALQPVRITVNVSPGTELLLNPHQQTHLLQIVREAVSNSLRHSGGTRVTVTLRLEMGHPVLEIADNGQGFDTTVISENGRGLKNMSVRAAEIHAHMELLSAPGRSTTLLLRFRGHEKVAPEI